MESLEEIRAFFVNDRFATEAAGAVVDEAADGRATCSLRITPVHRNAAGAVMGGAIFALADFAFAVATNRPGSLTVTVSSTIEFVGQAKGERLIARAEPVKAGKSLCFYSTSVTDELGNLVAVVSTTGKRLS